MTVRAWLSKVNHRDWHRSLCKPVGAHPTVEEQVDNKRRLGGFASPAVSSLSLFSFSAFDFSLDKIGRCLWEAAAVDVQIKSCIMQHLAVRFKVVNA